MLSRTCRIVCDTCLKFMLWLILCRWPARLLMAVWEYATLVLKNFKKYNWKCVVYNWRTIQCRRQVKAYFRLSLSFCVVYVWVSSGRTILSRDINPNILNKEVPPRYLLDFYFQTIIEREESSTYLIRKWIFFSIIFAIRLFSLKNMTIKSLSY